MMKKNNSFEIFVPGRICLLGEHSDWITNYKKYDKNIGNGRNLVILLKQGIKAIVEKEQKKFIIEESNHMFEINFSKNDLFKYAHSNKFYSYSCGTAYTILNKFNVEGLRIKIINNDLPVAKGLSSSAAICVLIVKAFNLIYSLNLTDDEIMEFAYLGETICGSKCGKMDQLCCFKQGIFSLEISEAMQYKKIINKQDIYIVYSDLNSKKDTRLILDKLNALYPYAKNKKEKKAHFFLEHRSYKLVEQAEKCIENGNVKKLGKLMNIYQKEFDKYIAPFCYEQLKSPVLHSLINDKYIKKITLGAKGVGSQGDGSVQFLLNDYNSQKKLYNYLKEKSFKPCMLTIKKTNKIKRAFIAVAGKATRLYPYSKFMYKEFNPVIYNDVVKPAISVLLEELYDSGVERIYIGVASKRQKKFYIDYFKNKNSNKNNYEYEEKLNKIYNCLKFIVIKNSTGFGDTVSRFKKSAQNEPFLLLLGDTLYKSNNNISCIKQLLNCYNTIGKSIVGIENVSAKETINYGTCFGLFNNNIMKVDTVIEKPSLKFLKKINIKNKITSDKFYRLFGNYVLTPEFLDILIQELRKKDLEEVNITSSLNILAKKGCLYGLLIDGHSYDIGNVESYKNNFSKL